MRSEAIFSIATLLFYTTTINYICCYTSYSNDLKALENALDLLPTSYHQPLQQRNVHDGAEYTIKEAGVTYRQRLSKDQDADGHSLCTVEYDNRLLKEDETIEIKTKFYKVEECHLSRAYHACGPNILRMLKVVCTIAEQFTTIRV
ncbi:unnamed protein product, partial [Didymodactylos carnosus]